MQPPGSSRRNLSETDPLRQAVDAAGAALDADAEERAVVELAERLEGAAALLIGGVRHLPEDHHCGGTHPAVDVLPPLESLELVEDWLKRPISSRPRSCSGGAKPRCV